jgi:ribosomal-protein-alanine N-acetyltransferase
MTSTSEALVLEAATLEDLGALAVLEASCHTHPWSERGLRDAIAPAAGRGAVLVLRRPWTGTDDHRGILAYCAFEVVADEAHVHNLAVVPEARRHGLARRLLMLTLGIAARKGARAAHLEVRAGNAAARALYGGMGFREVGKRHGYYSAPVEDAVLLSRADLEGPGPANLERPSPKC